MLCMRVNNFRGPRSDAPLDEDMRPLIVLLLVESKFHVDAAKPNAPQDVVAVQIEHTTESCVVTALWHNRDNTPLRYYIVTISSYSLHHTIPVSSINSTRFSTVFSVPSCGQHSISVQTVDIYGREGPFVRVALNKQDCFIPQDSVCSAPTMSTTYISQSTPDFATTDSAANISLQGK